MSSQPWRSLLPLPSHDALLSHFAGQPISALPTPSILIDKSLFTAGCQRMAQRCKDTKTAFRSHVKSHKTTEGARIQLEESEGGRVVCSTIVECWKIVEAGFVAEGLVKDMLYGLPCGPDKHPDLHSLRSNLSAHNATMRLMIDNPLQISALEAYAAAHPEEEGKVWSVFIKVDGGGKRAGLPPRSEEMKELITVALASPIISIFGFYSHFGQSYASTTPLAAADFLAGEISCTSLAAHVALSLSPAPPTPYVLSVGATPTAHATSPTSLPSNLSALGGVLEIHAGVYCCLDVQQLSTSLITIDQIAVSVLSHVISLYPHRGEAMCDSGGIAMSKDSGPAGGFGWVLQKDEDGKWVEGGWEIGRMSQEHGIMTRRAGWEGRGRELALGEAVRVLPQHACMTLAAHPWYFVVEEDKVVDVWVAWKGW